MAPTIQLSSSDLHEILASAISVAQAAGDLILQGSDAILSSGNVDEKKNSVDLVTEYDVKVEELVKGAGLWYIGTCKQRSPFLTRHHSLPILVPKRTLQYNQTRMTRLTIAATPKTTNERA